MSSDQKNQLARYIARTLTIRQRNFIPNIFKKDDYGDIDLDRAKQILGITNIYGIRGDLDAFLIFGQMAQADTQQLFELADPEKGMDGIKDLGNHLIELWGHEIRHKRFAAFILDPLPEDEMPEEMAAAFKLVLVKSYFENKDGFRFPKLLM